MGFLDSIERKCAFLALPNLTLHWTLGQILVFGLSLLKPEILYHFLFIPQKVLEGEIWRLGSFLLAPPVAAHPLFLIIIWYWFWILGREVEGMIGDFRYTLFMLLNTLTTVGLAFLAPLGVYSNAFILSTVFLVFALIKPNFEVLLFFILPVKFKWLAGLIWLGYGYILFTSPAWNEKLMVIAIVLSFLIFFGKDLWLKLREMKH